MTKCPTLDFMDDGTRTFLTLFLFVCWMETGYIYKKSCIDVLFPIRGCYRTWSPWQSHRQQLLPSMFNKYNKVEHWHVDHFFGRRCCSSHGSHLSSQLLVGQGKKTEEKYSFLLHLQWFVSTIVTDYWL